MATVIKDSERMEVSGTSWISWATATHRLKELMANLHARTDDYDPRHFRGLTLLAMQLYVPVPRASSCRCVVLVPQASCFCFENGITGVISRFQEDAFPVESTRCSLHRTVLFKTLEGYRIRHRSKRFNTTGRFQEWRLPPALCAIISKYIASHAVVIFFLKPSYLQLVNT